jgi:membrane associated rhomboid family serine protease
MPAGNRDYMRSEARRYGGGGFGGGGGISGGGGRLHGQSVVTWLLIANVVVFLWDGIFGTAMRGSFLALTPIGAFDVERGVYGFQVWRFFTYQFLHAGFLHLLFNMIGLFFFGPLLEQWWGPKRFLAFYLLCGMCGSVLYTLMVIAVPGLIFPVEALAARGFTPAMVPLVGASGALFGILAACAALFPHQRVQLIFPPIPMTMRTMALIFLGLAAVSVIAGSANAGGEAAHLGGALLGFIFAKQPSLLNWADRVSPAAIQGGVNEGRYRRKVEKEQATEAEVDRILAKVQAKGLQSLTRGEKKTLNRATERKNR